MAILDGGDFTGDAEALPYLLHAYRLIGYQCLSLSPRDQKQLRNLQLTASGLSILSPIQNDEKSTHLFSIKNDGVAVGVVNIGKPNPKDQKTMKWLMQALKLSRSRLVDSLKESHKDLKESYPILLAITYSEGDDANRLVKALNGVVDALLVDEGTIHEPFDEMGASFTFVSTRGSILSPQQEVAGVRRISLPKNRSMVLSVMVWKEKKGKGIRLESTLLSSQGYPDEPQVKKVVDEYFTIRQKQLQSEMQKLMSLAEKKTYFPPEFCGSCHKSQYEHWLTTEHSKALDTLKKGNRMDKSCLNCHSSEFRMRGIFKETKKRGVECVDCHTELKDPAKAKMHGLRPRERPSVTKVPEQVCRSCHTPEHDKDFDQMTDMPKVKH